MSEDVFRIVVAVGVVLGCLAFVAQAFVVFALYRSSRAMQQKASPLIEHLEPFLNKMEPVIARAGVVLEKAGPVIEKAGPVIERIGPVADQVQLVLASANRIMIENAPHVKEISSRINEISSDAAAMVKIGRQQVDRIGDVVEDASARATERLEQLDHSIETTIDKLEHVGDSMKRTVFRPVREANGFAAGVSAAVSALMHGRKSSVDSATQDEEMFI